MRLLLTGRHIDVTPTLRQLVQRRLARLERLLNDAALTTQVVLTREKRELRAEITVHARGDHMLSAIGTADTWPQAVGQAVEKVMQQAHKVKDKWRTRKRRAVGPRRAVAAETEAAEPRPAATDAELNGRRTVPRIVRMTRYAVKPMRVEDAALRIQETREPFIVFRHAETERLAILFERPDGRLGLIDPES
ncbi:MAG TPA: ribosome-associated translation inhibitor RaiA [Vicinamibacterales bacterium]